MNKSISAADIRRVFAEARGTTNSGHLEYNVHCPFPHRKGGANFKMYINASTGVFHCCDCGRSGSFWEEFCQERRGKSGRVKVGQWESKLIRDDSVLEEVRSPLVIKFEKMPIWQNGVRSPGETLIPLTALPAAHPANQYLTRERGFDPGVFGDPAGPWKAHYCEGGVSFLGGKATTGGRIIIPFYVSGVLKGWTARLIEFRKNENQKITWNGTDFNIVSRDPNGAWPDRFIPKYFHMPGMNKSVILYNGDQARDYDQVWAFEGPMDVWAFGPDAVCYNGEFPSAIQCRLLSMWNSVRWGMDPEVDIQDPVKRRRHRKVLDSVESEDFEWIVLSGGDPGSLGRAEVERQFITPAAE